MCEFDMQDIICSTCSLASICTNREDFIAFYKNRDQIMVKAADEDGNLDSGLCTTARIEYRYLDGPALEQIYRELGLGNPHYCCMQPAIYCPIMDKHPFDTPVTFGNHSPVGYIEPLCHSARYPDGQRIPFTAVRDTSAPAATNFQFANMDGGTEYRQCKSCNLPHDNHGDIAKIGGSVFSAFASKIIDVTIGDTILLSDVTSPAPGALRPNYVVATNITPESFEITENYQTFIVYYQYDSPIDEEPDYEYMTIAQIEAAGMIHNMELFHGEHALVYPSTYADSFSVTTMIHGIVAGVGRCDTDGTILVRPGELMAFDYETPDSAILISALDEFIQASSGEIIVALDTGTVSSVLTDDDGTLNSVTAEAVADITNLVDIDISDGNYMKFHFAEGDTLLMSITIPSDFVLDFDTISILSYPLKPNVSRTLSYNNTTNMTTYVVSVKMETKDVQFQTVAVKNSLFMDVATYPRIDYVSAWENDKYAFAANEVAVFNGLDTGTAYPALAPRLWSKEFVADDTPDYVKNVPGAAKIVRPHFTLTGYVSDAASRFNFDPALEIIQPKDVTEVTSLHYLDTTYAEDGRYFGMWKVDYATAARRFYGTLKRESTGITTIDEYAIPTSVSTRLFVSDGEYNAQPLQNTFNVVPFAYTGAYSPTLADDFRKMVQSAIDQTLKGYTFSDVYALPIDAEEIYVYESFTHNEDAGHAPDATIKYVTEDGLTQISKLTDFESSEDDRIGLGKTVGIIMVYPENCAGLSPWNQNFIAFEVIMDIYECPIDLVAVYSEMFHGKATVSEKTFKYMKLDGIPEADHDYVDVEVSFNDDGTATYTLTGDHAYRYTLDYVDEVVEHDIRVDYRYHVNDGERVEVRKKSELFKIADRDGIFVAVANKESSYTVKKMTLVFQSEDGPVERELLERDGTIALTRTFMCKSGRVNVNLATEEDDMKYFDISLFNITGDFVIDVDLELNSPNEIEACERCTGYIDASPDSYSWLEWIPDCTNYSPES